ESSSELLATATTDAKNCDSPLLDNDVDEIRQVRDQRQAELNQAQGLNTADLPNGAEIQSSLTAALNDSLVVDADYLFWAKQQANPATCAGGSSPAEIEADNNRATADKTSFLNLWNPVAAQYGL